MTNSLQSHVVFFKNCYLVMLFWQTVALTSDSVGMMQARLHIPAFTRGKSQLDALEVENTRTIANVRIHVERVIGVVRQKYSILRGILPIDFVSKKLNQDSPHIDKIIRVCCCLCNVCDSVVPFD